MGETKRRLPLRGQFAWKAAKSPTTPDRTEILMASWRWRRCVRPPKGTRDEFFSLHSHDSSQGTAHRVSLARTARYNRCVRSDRHRAVQFYVRSNIFGIAAFRAGTAVARVSFRRVADAPAVFPARAHE